MGEFCRTTPIQRILLKSKIHRATVTDAHLRYEGSVTIDRQLMDSADLIDSEQLQIYDVNNGNRLTTYVISGEAGSGTIFINGAATHLVRPGVEARQVKPRVVHVDERNRPKIINGQRPITNDQFLV